MPASGRFKVTKKPVDGVLDGISLTRGKRVSKVEQVSTRIVKGLALDRPYIRFLVVVLLKGAIEVSRGDSNFIDTCVCPRHQKLLKVMNKGRVNLLEEFIGGSSKLLIA